MDRIQADDLRAGKYDRASVETWLVVRSNPVNRVLLRTAKIGRIEINGNAFKVELQSPAEAMDKRRGWCGGAVTRELGNSMPKLTGPRWSSSITGVTARFYRCRWFICNALV